MVGSITDRAAVWWDETLTVVLQAYQKFQKESPLNRLKIQVGDAPADEQKWARLEKRVLTLLLQSMPRTIKTEITMLRISKVKDCMFKLYSVYAPGGATERASLIRQLETIPVHENVLDVTLALRKWKKLLGRASEMGVSLPDGSVLLVAVETAIRRVVEGHRDMAFKLNMAKQSLQLPHLPLLASVVTYVDHVLAELQQVIPLGRGDIIKLKGLQSDPSSPTSTNGSPARATGGKGVCKYFLSDDGCRRGALCKYSHDFTSKEEKRSRCWDCGSTKHRRKECPVAAKQKGQKQLVSASTSSVEHAGSTALATITAPQPPALMEALQGQPAQVGPPSTETTSSAASTVLLPEAKEKDVQDLLREANAVLNKFVKLQALQARTNESVGELDGVVRSMGLAVGERSALLDSGASHPFRVPRSNQEHHEAKRVAVQLADGRTVRLRQTQGGTLLPAEASSSTSPSCTILPLGSLVESLGCTLRWSKKRGLQVSHPRYGLLPTKLVGNCPVLREHEALQLISDLEDLELARLREQTLVGAVQTLEVADNEAADWSFHLEDFLSSGQRVALRRMLRDPGCPLREETELGRMALVGDLDLGFSEDVGAKYMKALPFSRARRRRLLRTRWAVHLFSGDEGATEFHVIEDGETAVVNVDIRVSKGLDLLNDSVFRVLLWAAGRGQVEGVYGGPPRGSGEGPALLIKRMLMLWSVAERGAAREGLRTPFFALELPSKHPFWRGSSWERFNVEYDFPLVRVQDYLFATDMDIQGEPVTVDSLTTASWNPIASWPPWLRTRLTQGMASWRQSTRTVRMARTLARLQRSPESMTEAELRQWEARVRNGHTPYNRHCRTCVRTAGTGKAHRRTLAPSAYTLSLDIAGPFRRRAECADGGGYRYALVGSYCHPKLEGFKDEETPEDPMEGEGDPFEPFEDEVHPAPSVGDEPGDPPLEEEDEYQRAMNQRFQNVYKDIGDAIEYQSLQYVVPLRTKTAVEVLKAVRHVYLSIRREGLPFVRLHSDRAREFCTEELRSWCEAHDIMPTTGESQAPQQNGRAEAAVQQLKNKAKTLLRASGLPPDCWALAMRFASAKQRMAALGLKDDADGASFGAVVHCKAKMFGEGGRYDLKETWTQGQFVGWSSDVAHGKVVRLDSGGFITATHIRPFLIDADDLVALDPLEAHAPLPERRVRGKTTLRGVQATLKDDVVEGLARALLEEDRCSLGDALEFWDIARKHSTPRTRACFHGESPSHFSTGLYSHGGFTGLLTNTYKFPNTTAYLTKVFEAHSNQDEFATLTVSENVGMQCHRDVHNERSTENIIVPLVACKGGGVWVESLPENHRWDDVWRQIPSGEWRRGQVHELHAGVPLRFNSRLWHATEPWEGRRLVLIGFTPRMKSMTQPTYEALLDAGFNPPALRSHDFVTPALNMMSLTNEDAQVDAVVFLVRERRMPARDNPERALQDLHSLQEDILARLGQRAEFLNDILAEEEMLASELADISQLVKDEACEAKDLILDLLKDVQSQMATVAKESSNHFLRAAALAEEESEAMADLETWLASLEEDLGVTLTVPLEQAKGSLDKWVESMSKELTNVEQGTGAVARISYAAARALEAQGKLRLIPGKMVFTVKPPAEPSSSSSTKARWKRKSRLVICGNRVGVDADHTRDLLYAAGASAESLRVALCLASAAGWSAGSTDITGAFLLATWPSDKPTYGVIPPRILIQAGLIDEGTVLLVKRPLYGLREAPALWAAYRTEKLKETKVEYDQGVLTLQPLVSDSELWLILYASSKNNTSELYGIMVTYVDDILYLALLTVMQAVHSAVSGMWPCSTLELATKPGGIRYLGMELEEVEGDFTLGQKGYIDNLAKSYGMPPDMTSNLPCPKDWLVDDEGDVDHENFSEDELRRGQKIVGECLWLAYRARPDLVFITNYMSSIVGRRPCFTTRIGQKVLAYLSSSAGLKITMSGTGDSTSSSSSSEATVTFKHTTYKVPFKVPLVGYSDASFAPFGGKSFGCSVAVVGSSPVAWKAGKQPYVTMSVCEAELVEGSTCALLLESIQALLSEACGYAGAAQLRIDNAAAGNLLSGSAGSWRTRHLRVRYAYVLDKVSSKQLEVVHTPGELQLADLPTKLHGRSRLVQLLDLWGMRGIAELNQTKAVQLIALSCVFCMMVAVQSLGVWGAKFSKDPLPSTGAWELTFVLALSCVAAVFVWEVVKYILGCVARACCGSRKSQQLQRLRDMARLAAEAELDRAMDAASEAEVQHARTSVSQAVSTTLHRDRTSQGTQTDAGWQVERVREVQVPREVVVYRDVPRDVPVPTPGQPLDRIYMSDHGGHVHVDGDCRGFRLVSSRVRTYQFCDICMSRHSVIVQNRPRTGT